MMVFRHDEYSEKALNNQTRTTTVTASRGSIYDRNMNVMAVSTSVENVFLIRKELHDNQVDLNWWPIPWGDFKSGPGWIQEQASDITMRYKMLATKQPDEASKIRDFIVENDIIGIHLEPGFQTDLPYSSLAAQVIGFTNSSNVGAEGLRPITTTPFRELPERSSLPRAIMRRRCPIPLKILRSLRWQAAAWC